MAKVVLGKTPEELEAERAKKEREQEAEIQAAIQERQKKIQALHSKQKLNKFIVFAVIIVLTGILITFGTYNTFFKRGLTTEDVSNVVNQAMYRNIYPTEGLNNYVHDNCTALFEKYMTVDVKHGGKNIESVEVDPDSCYIFKVRKLSPTLSQVYFAVDIVTTEKDTIVTDPTIIEQLRRGGFGVNTNVTTDTTTVVEELENTEPEEIIAIEEETTEETTEEENTEDIVESNNEDEVSDENTEETTDESTTEESTTEESVEEDPTPVESEELEIPTTEIDYAVNKTSEVNHYYMTANGVIMQSGKVTRERYYFYIPIELVYTYDGETPVTAGYAPAGNMNLYSLIETDQVDFKDININSVFAFNEEAELDEDTVNKMQVKVDNTLRSLYEGTDTSQDFLNYRLFNSYDGNYLGITEFMAYSEPNSLGYNVFVTYTIVTSQGFNYTLETYMKVEQNGSTWVVTDIM